MIKMRDLQTIFLNSLNCTKIIAAFLTFLFIGISMSLGAQNSPVVTLGTVSTSASTVVVSVTVANFTNIKACDLKMLYNQAIANPTGVAKGTGLGGSVSVNLSNPGEIVIGWYAGAGISMTDGSAIFNITFNKLSFGTLNLEFDFTDDYDCQFYDSTNQKLIDVPSGTFYIPGSITFLNDTECPVTTIPTLTAALNDNINIPVSVTGFNNIGAVSLTLKYDSLALRFNSAINTGGFPDMIINNPKPGIVTVSGITNNPSGFSLTNNSVFFTLNFTYLKATAAISWFDDGTSCEYASRFPDYNVLNDIPQSTYFIDGSVSSNQATPGILAGTVTNPTTCSGNGIIPLTLTNVPDGTYTVNYDGGSFPNIDVLANAAIISASAGIYNNLQITVNGLTSALGVNVVLTDPAAPDQPVIAAGGPTTFCEGGNVVLTSSEALTYQWSTGETTQNITVSVSGNYSVTVSNASVCGAMSEVLEVIVNAKPEKPAEVNCWDEFNFNTNTCIWENSGVKPAEPAKVNCWDDFRFNETLCTWENKGTEPGKPAIVNCWDVFEFNNTNCTWDNIGTQPIKPTPVNCWDEFSFNTNSCMWENSGVKPAEPAKANCWDDYQFNSILCTWENKGTEPLKPEIVNCWDNFEFNSTSCIWDNIGTQPIKPNQVNCWDEFSFNTNSCMWENSGVKPAEPSKVNCWDDYQFVEANCAWENIGAKPVEPTPLKSWDEYIFNPVNCAWENIGIATGVDIYGNAEEMTLTCYPNPFSEKATIQYLLPENGNVNIEVTGILGNRIKLLSNQFQSAGEYLLDLDGEILASGIYQITLRLTGVNGGEWTKTIRTIKQ